MRHLTSLLLVLASLTLLVTGCISPPRNSGAGGAETAVWKVDHDAGLAVPHCPHCDEIVSRKSDKCLKCGTECRIVQQIIDCPECAGEGECGHCNAPGTCIPCDGTGKCGICLGKGEFEGAECPECEGARFCHDCAGDAIGEKCEYCEDSHECANCGGDGEIELN